MSNENTPQATAPAAESQVAEATAPEATASDESIDSEEGEAADAQLSTEAPLTKAEQKKLIKSLKLKVDGKEFDEELPFEIPDDEDAKAYMTKQLQLSKAAQKRMAETAKMQQDMQEFLQLLKSDPEAILSDPNIGIDLKKFATKIIEKEIENAKKSPEQLEKERLQEELKRLKEERENEKKASEEKERERLQAQEYERYDILMSQALEKSDLPKSPYVVKKMADHMLLGINKGLDVTPADVLPLVRDEIIQDIKEMFEVMPEEVIESIVGADKISKLRKKRVAAVKAAQSATPAQVKDTGQTSKKDEAVEKKKIPLGDWLKS